MVHFSSALDKKNFALFNDIMTLSINKDSPKGLDSAADAAPPSTSGSSSTPNEKADLHGKSVSSSSSSSSNRKQPAASSSATVEAKVWRLVEAALVNKGGARDRLFGLTENYAQLVLDILQKVRLLHSPHCRLSSSNYVSRFYDDNI